jgi:hypothetical protein
MAGSFVEGGAVGCLRFDREERRKVPGCVVSRAESELQNKNANPKVGVFAETW